MTRPLILIMDPSHATRAMYADCFRHHGFTVVEAVGGAEALHLYNQLGPDLVITEMSTDPGWTAAIMHARGNEDDRTTATIACSTSIDPRWPCAPLGIDVDLAVGKPISPRVLLRAAQQLLRRRGAGAIEAVA